MADTSITSEIAADWKQGAAGRAMCIRPLALPDCFVLWWPTKTQLHTLLKLAGARADLWNNWRNSFKDLKLVNKILLHFHIYANLYFTGLKIFYRKRCLMNEIYRKMFSPQERASLSVCRVPAGQLVPRPRSPVEPPSRWDAFLYAPGWPTAGEQGTLASEKVKQQE